MSFKMRTTKPEAGNKYYITKANGGYSNAIKGKPTDADCDVLSNCVGYAYGRFNEIGGYGYCKYLKPVNAERFILYKDSVLEVGQTPKLGACMVWQRGDTLSGDDGAGHVAIVERVISDTEVYTSESGWNSKPFWNQTRKKGNGNWGNDAGAKFLGFIYNPAVKDEPITTAPASPKPEVPTTHKLVVGDEVKLVSGATYTSGKLIPAWVFRKVLYVREVRTNGDIVVSTLKTGAVTGVVSSKYLTKNGKPVSAQPAPTTPPATKPTEPTAKPSTPEYKIGDIVNFTGNKHYVSSNATSPKGCKAGVAKVTAIAKGAKHPYHLIRESGKGSTVWGWVDVSDISGKVSNISSSTTNTTTNTNTAANSSVKVDLARHLDKSLAGTYSAVTGLNMRAGAGVGKTILTVIPKGGKVTCHGYYTVVNGTKWFYVIHKNTNGVEFTGFASSKYLEKVR